MTFKQAVRHLEKLGFTVESNGHHARSARATTKTRDGRRVVPVIEVDRLPRELDEMIRRSRAEVENSIRSRKRR